MALEVKSERAVCTRCGTAFGSRKGNFPVSYADIYKGSGYIPICKNCIEKMYEGYLGECDDQKMALRQMCRKLDIFWSDAVYNSVLQKSTSRTVISRYLTRIASSTYAGKSYDDTLQNEGTLWSFVNNIHDRDFGLTNNINEDGESDDSEIPEERRRFWGAGYTPAMYRELEGRWNYWMSRAQNDIELDIGAEALIRQICSLELDINRDRAAGRSVVNSVTALNSLIGSANLKPAQKKQDDINSSVENTPFGVWIKKWEDARPIPEPDPELEDVDGLVKYIEIWFKGHISKMLGFKNVFSKLYQKAIDKMRVDHPEYEDEDDEDLFTDLFDEDDEDGQE